jgi:hypothetical protein
MKARAILVSVLLISLAGFSSLSWGTFVGNAQKDASPETSQRNSSKESSKNDEIPTAVFSPGRTELQKRQIEGDSSANYLERIKEIPKVTEITESESWIEKIPALPVKHSDVIVIGEVVNAQAFITPEQTKVYSEFNVNVDEVLKDTTGLRLTSGSLLITEREGGRVKFPSGHMQIYKLSGEGFARIGRRYVLFLKRKAEAESFTILTGYELRAGHIVPLDKVSLHDSYRGWEERVFIDEVRNAMTEPASSGEKGAGR